MPCCAMGGCGIYAHPPSPAGRGRVDGLAAAEVECDFPQKCGFSESGHGRAGLLPQSGLRQEI
jgi:hypothetical protein